MKLKHLGLILLAVVAGEIVLALLTTLVQEVIYGHIDHWLSAPPLHIVLAGIGNVLAAIVAGWVVGKISSNYLTAPLAIVSLLIAAETTWLISSGRTVDPVWFDVLAGFSLIVGIWIGGYLDRFLPGRSLAVNGS